MKLVCIGDSLTNGFRINRKYVWTYLLGENLDIKVVNAGINGDSTNGMLSRFHLDVISQMPNSVIIMGGVNDLLAGVSIEQIVSNILTMVHQSNHNGIEPYVCVPMNIDVKMAMSNWGGLSTLRDVNFYLQEIRERLKGFSELFHFNYIDLQYEFDQIPKVKIPGELFLDGLHLTMDSNFIVSRILSKKIKSICSTIVENSNAS